MQKSLKMPKSQISGPFPPIENIFFCKKKFPQFLYIKNHWKNTRQLDFENFCNFQPYLLNSVQMLSTLPKNVWESVNGLCSYQDEVNQFYALGELDEGQRWMFVQVKIYIYDFVEYIYLNVKVYICIMDSYITSSCFSREMMQ